MACGLLLLASEVQAQRLPSRFRPGPAVAAANDSEARPARLHFPAIPSIVPAWTAPIASALVPGAGQVILGQQRFVAYIALEAFIWVEYFKDRQDEHEQGVGYRDLAARVARSAFSSSAPVGTWSYYELLKHNRESGVFSLTGSTTSVEPETDETTYNGGQWLLARRTFWSNPTITPSKTSDAYQRALEFYIQRAIRPEYRWSWSNAQLEQDLYGGMIGRANSASRRATSALGVLAANHVISSVDAFATLRVRLTATPHGTYGLTWTVQVP
jgi:hypothetical protein